MSRWINAVDIMGVLEGLGRLDPEPGSHLEVLSIAD